MIDFTIRRNGTYYIPDNIINILLSGSDFANTVDLYRDITQLTNEPITVLETSVLVPSQYGTAATSGCTGTCLIAVGVAVPAAVLLLVGGIVLFIMCRRRWRRRAQAKREREDGIGNVSDTAHHPRWQRNPIHYHEPFRGSPLRMDPDPVHYFHVDDLVEPPTARGNNSRTFLDFKNYDDDDEEKVMRPVNASRFIDVEKEERESAYATSPTRQDFESFDYPIEHVDDVSGDYVTDPFGVEILSVGSSPLRSTTARSGRKPIIFPRVRSAPPSRMHTPQTPRAELPLPAAYHPGDVTDSEVGGIDYEDAADHATYEYRTVRVAADVDRSVRGSHPHQQPPTARHPSPDEYDEYEDGSQYEYEYVYLNNDAAVFPTPRRSPRTPRMQELTVSSIRADGSTTPRGSTAGRGAPPQHTAVDILPPPSAVAIPPPTTTLLPFRPPSFRPPTRPPPPPK